MISGIIMASGFSKRMKQDKLILPINDIPIIERVFMAVENSSINDSVVIYRQPEVREIAKKYGIKAVYNEKADKGQSEAMKLGIKMSNPKAMGYMFFVADQPFLNTNIINHLIEAFYKAPQIITLPLYEGKRGNPVIFPVAYKDVLLGIMGDQGGRNIIAEERCNYVSFEDSISGMDIDTWQQYIKICGGDETNEKEYSGS